MQLVVSQNFLKPLNSAVGLLRLSVGGGTAKLSGGAETEADVRLSARRLF